LTLEGESLVQRPNPLHARAREIEEVRRLSAGLHDRDLPAVELTTTTLMRIPLQAHLSGLVVVYFVPGEMDGSAWVDGHPTLDAAQHRGYVNRRDAFDDMRVKVFAVSSQSVEDLGRMKQDLEVAHLMFSDPELLVGHALGLPTVQDGGTSRYRRIALVADGGRIRAVFPALQDNQAAASARQVLAWITATYGDRSRDGDAG
jgi:peroxiredoxin